jgi:predicted dinucleotide-binding enzyme
VVLEAISRLVKAFNTMYYVRLRTEGRPSAPEEERLAHFVAGGDGEAKAVVSRLIEEIGFAPVDTGSLSDGRKHEPDSPIHNVPMDPERQARETLAGMR